VALDRVVVRPVREATGAVARFGAGERGLKLAPRGAAELTALAHAFNETAAAVERAERENAELRTRLEEKVRERTAALVRAARASTAGTMAGGIAHEFNNLLGGILGCADAALAESPAPEVRESLEMIRKTAGRGVGVTKALLRATRAEPDLAPCDPAALFDEALAEARPPPEVEVVRDLRPLALAADAAMLRQVLANLVRNAIQAMEGRGTLRLSATREGDEAVLAVEDTGPGVPEAVRDILFEPFVTTRRGGREGAGLGLFLADRLVAAHGGRIDVSGEAGKGARFTVRLPLRA
jgi:signal transduction histidine kinase